MRTRIVAAALAVAVAACSGDDGGDGPGVDGGDPFVGSYTATWSPAHPRFDVRFGCVTSVASDPMVRSISFYDQDPALDCLTIAPGSQSDSYSGSIDGSCIASEDPFFYTVDICTTESGLAGTVIDANDGSPIMYAITMTRR